MGLLSSSQTIIRYQVEDIKEEQIIETIRAGLIKHAMPEIIEENQEIMAGWVPFEAPYTPDFELKPFQYGSEFIFSLRVDKKTIPAKALALQLAVAIQEKLKETGRDFISRNEKAEMKEIITEKFMLRQPFVPTIHEVSWNYETGIVMFYSGQKAANEMFESFFLKSFNRRIHRLFPYTIAFEHLNDDEAIMNLTPSEIGGAAC